MQNAVKLAGFKFLEPQDVNHDFNGKIGKKETAELDRLEEIYNIILERQYRVQTEYGVYFIDGYDKANNIAYEIDDGINKYIGQQELDMMREKHIRSVLNCRFVRIKIY